MNKMTIATDHQGNVLGASHHVEERKVNGGMHMGVSFVPGAQLHVDHKNKAVSIAERA